VNVESTILAVYAGFAIATGLVLGSFANVAIARLPFDASVVSPRSRCPRCASPIAWYDNLPVLSWIALRGRCRSCAAPISASYPLVELLGGLLAWMLFRRMFHGVEDLDLAHGLAFAWWMSFLTALVIGAYTDLRHWILPDEVTVYLVPLGILGAFGLEQLGYHGALAPSWRASALAAGALGGLFAGMSGLAWWALGREGLGWGDVKLAAMIGAFLGVGAWVALLVGAVFGAAVHVVRLVVRGEAAPLPYGPSLCAAAALQVFIGDTLTARLFPGLHFLSQHLGPP
jgi:leader peptidase (prepilin peptidase)/N-methyltransferase